MSAHSRYFDPVQVAQSGSVMAGLEGAAATGAGGVLLWGWLWDPEAQLRGLACRFGERTAAVEILDRIPRPELSEMHPALVGRGASELGFLGFVQADPNLVREAGGRARLEIQSHEGSASSANRMQFEAGASFRSSVGERLPLSKMRPAALLRAAEALWAPEAVRALDEAGRRAQVQAFGPAGQAQLSLVVPLGRDLGGLRETLVYLDMNPESSELELVLSLTDEEDFSEVVQAVRRAAARLAVRVARSGGWLSVGAAARLGLEAASAPSVLLMSDAVVPPSRPWMERSLADLTQSGFAAPRALPRFDGMVERYQPARVGAVESSWSHEEVVTELQTGMQQRGLNDWSPGLVAGRRESLLSAPIAWSGSATAEGFWASAMAAAVGAEAAPLQAGDGFTLAPLHASGSAQPEDGWALLDAYSMARQLRDAARVRLEAAQ